MHLSNKLKTCLGEQEEPAAAAAAEADEPVTAELRVCVEGSEVCALQRWPPACLGPESPGYGGYERRGTSLVELVGLVWDIPQVAQELLAARLGAGCTWMWWPLLEQLEHLQQGKRWLQSLQFCAH